MVSQTSLRSVEQTVEDFRKSSEALLREIKNNPEKAKAFLIRAGIAQISDSTPSGIELVPQLRSDED